MKKLKIYIGCLILFTGLFNFSANAENYNVHNPDFPKSANPYIEDATIDILAEIYNAVNANGVRENMPEAAEEYLGSAGSDGAGNLSIGDISGRFSFGFIFNIIMRLLGSLVSVAVKNFIPVIAFIILGAVINVLKNLNGKDGFSDIINFVLIVCLAGAVFFNVRDCFYISKKFLEDIHVYMTTMIPVMASLSTVSGNAASAAANSAGLYVALNVIGAMSGSIILPVLQICFALSLANQLTSSSDTVNLGGISSYMRSVLNWIFIFVMTILTAVLLFQNILASSADNVAARTVKFTVSSFVPVVGGMIGEVSKTIIGSIQIVKSITGIFGVLVIIITLLPPLITVILNKLMLKISGAFALILGMDKHADFLKEMNSLLDITVALMVSASLVFIFDITVFIKTMAVF